MCHLRHVAFLKQACTSIVSVDHLKIPMPRHQPPCKKARTEASFKDETGKADVQAMFHYCCSASREEALLFLRTISASTRRALRFHNERIVIPDDPIDILDEPISPVALPQTRCSAELASAEQPAAETCRHKDPEEKRKAPNEIVIIPDDIELEEIFEYLEDLTKIWQVEASCCIWMQEIRKCIEARAKEARAKEQAARACEQQPSDLDHSILSVSDKEASKSLEGSEQITEKASRLLDCKPVTAERPEHAMTGRIKELALRRLPVHEEGDTLISKKCKRMRDQLDKSLNGKLTTYSPMEPESLAEMWIRIVTHWRTAIGPLSWRMNCLKSLSRDASEAHPQLLRGLKEALRTARGPLNADAEMMLWCKELLALRVIE